MARCEVTGQRDDALLQMVVNRIVCRVARRILLLITDLEIGGTPTVVRELAIRLNNPPEVVVEVACLKRWGPVADQLRDAGITVTSFDATRPWQLPSVVRALGRLVAERGFDTVFSFLVHANVVAAAALRTALGVRRIQSVQTTQPYPRWHWRAQRWAAKFAERVVVPSPSVARFAAERSAIPAQRFVVIPNAVDPAAFVQSQVPLQPPHPFPVGFIGRLDPIKRVPVLACAVGHLGGLAHLHVWGEGPDKVNIEQEIDVWLPGLLTFHGYTGQVNDALSQIGLLVLPSKAEGFGLVLIEAMAAGVPVIGTNVPGIRDVIRHDSNGLLVDGQWPVTPLQEAIRRVVEDMALRQRLIDGGLADVRQRFSWDVVLPQYRRLLGIHQS